MDAARRGFNASGPGSTNIRYPDNQQIFVGNLPYEISEDDLREHFTGICKDLFNIDSLFYQALLWKILSLGVTEQLSFVFSDFGSVLEVRINQSNSNNPNFGFVIFEDPKSVQSVLEVMVSCVISLIKIHLNLFITRLQNQFQLILFRRKVT